MLEPRGDPGHLSDEQLAAFLDGRLTPQQRMLAVAHLSECPSCRHDMTAARRLLRDRRAVPRRWFGPALTLIAAVVAFAAVGRVAPRGFDPGPARSPAGVSEPDAAAAVRVVSPNDRAVVSDSGLTLRWESAGAAATYHVMLQDATGGLLWDATTADTVVTPPYDVGLVPGQHYFWSVDAKLADGRSAKAAIRRFTVR